MKNLIVLTACAFLCQLLCVPLQCVGDVVTLTSGKKLEGKVVKEDDKEIQLKTPQGMTLTIKHERIKLIEKGATLKKKSKRKKESDVIELKYGDGKSDGKKSIGGGGHAVLFRTPEGKWSVNRVSIFGSRYGYPQPPKEDFIIYICDKKMKVIEEIKRPYSMFKRGDPKWVDIKFPPIKVPREFYVCVNFNPGRTKGVYVHYDSNSFGHSRQALPGRHNSAVRGKFDWMIKAKITTAPAHRLKASSI